MLDDWTSEEIGEVGSVLRDPAPIYEISSDPGDFDF